MAEIYIHMSLQGHIQTNLGPLLPPEINSSNCSGMVQPSKKDKKGGPGWTPSPTNPGSGPGQAPESVILDGENHCPRSTFHSGTFQEA